MRVQLTERGEALREVLPPVLRRLSGEVFAGVSDEERRQLTQLLERLARNPGATV